jgi:hypothetical protein
MKNIFVFIRCPLLMLTNVLFGMLETGVQLALGNINELEHFVEPMLLNASFVQQTLKNMD